MPATIVLTLQVPNRCAETDAWTALSDERQNKSYVTVEATVGEFLTECRARAG